MPNAMKHQIDIDDLIHRIEQGETMRQIANDIGCSVGSVHKWLNATPEASERSARALALSAEAWLDRGLEAVERAMDRTAGIDATAARAYAQECARRAAIRNPRYRDQQSVQHIGHDGGSIKVDLIERKIVRPGMIVDVGGREGQQPTPPLSISE